MTTPQLPHTDFANVAMLPGRQRRRVLENHSTFVPPYSLAPFRKTLHDICNVGTGLFQFQPSPLAPTLKQIEKRCRRFPKSLELNLEVAEALWMHLQDRNVYALQRDMAPVAMGQGRLCQYWHDFYMVEGDVLIAPFFDPRKGSTRLSREGALFACSMSKYFLSRGRFSAMKPRIYQFPPTRDGRQIVEVEFMDSQLLPIEEIENRVTETEWIWEDILRRRAA